MSGAEATAVLGVISSIITVIDATKKVYDAATNSKGLPDAFRQVALRLPVVQSILESAKEHITDLDEDSRKAVKDIVDACEEKAKRLEVLFEKTVSGEGASSFERYSKALKTLGKGNTVQLLMKGILDDLHLLAYRHHMTNTTRRQEDELAKAIAEVSEMVASKNATTTHPATTDDTDHEAVKRYQAAFHLTDPDTMRESIRTMKGRRIDGTCEWIRTNRQYQSWLNGNLNFLWITGGPGKGKTMLSLFLAEELEKKTESTTILFFCNSQDEKCSTAAAILKGLINQIVSKHDNIFRKHVLPYFDSQKKAQNTASSLETLWIIFKKLVQDPKLGAVFCVLDGLDECDEDSSRFLTQRLVEFFSSHAEQVHNKAVKLVIVSRKVHGLQGTTQVKLDPDNDDEVASDIERFIAVRVDELSRIEGFTDQFRTFVEAALRKRAEGTFLWVGYVMNELSKKTTCTEIQDVLKDIPSGLPAIYDRMLLQIESGQRAISIKILHWVALAVRPLSLGELAVALDLRPSGLVSEDQARRDHVTRCGSFLQLHGDTVSFVHQSAKDYLMQSRPHQNPILESFRIREEELQFEFAQKCLEHVSNKSFDSFEYAVRYWPEHAKCSGTRSELLIGLFPEFFEKNSKSRRAWITFYERIEGPAPYELLHLASYLGIIPWVRAFMRRSILHIHRPLNKKDEIHGLTPLFHAAARGHETIVRLLLATGKVDVNAKDRNGETILITAIGNGHEAIVKLLLTRDEIDVNVKDADGWNSLIYAMAQENEALIELLLVAGKADVNFKDKKGRTPLIRAIVQENEAIINLLLAADGIDVNAKDADGWTPLIYSLAQGNEAIIKLLLIADKIDVNAKDADGRTPLIHAVAQENETNITLLLTADEIDVNAKDARGLSPLIYALIQENETIMKLLLATDKIDVNPRDKEDQIPLSLAVSYESEPIVKLLLATGKVDVNAKDEKDLTPLSIAVHIGHEAIVEMLLATGNVDMNAKDKQGRTPLSLAVENGEETIVEMLQTASTTSSHTSAPLPA